METVPADEIGRMGHAFYADGPILAMAQILNDAGRSPRQRLTEAAACFWKAVDCEVHWPLEVDELARLLEETFLRLGLGLPGAVPVRLPDWRVSDLLLDLFTFAASYWRCALEDGVVVEAPA